MRSACTKDQHILFDKIFGTENKKVKSFYELKDLIGEYVRSHGVIPFEGNGCVDTSCSDILPVGYGAAFQALCRLLHLRDNWGGNDVPEGNSFCITVLNNSLHVHYYTEVTRIFSFSSRELAQEFLDTFKADFEIAKLLI